MEGAWTRRYPPGLPPSMEYTPTALHRLLEDSARRFPARAALLECDPETGREVGAKSYRAVDDDASRLASALLSLGLAKGDRVAYYLQNSIALVTAFYGILKAGTVAVPCNPMYRAEELAHQLRDSGAKILICDQDLWPVVQEVRSEASLQKIVVTGHGAPPPPGTVSFDSLVAAHGSLPSCEGSVSSSDLALLLYTGGTTGTPKGCMLTHGNLVTNALQFARWFGYCEGMEVFISVLPLFHSGGIAGAMSVPIAVGATMLLFRRFRAGAVLQAIERYRATRLPGVPTMYVALVSREDARGFDLTSLRPSRTGAAPLPPSVKEAFDALVGREVLIEAYGLTEASPLTHANPVHAARPGSIGVPLPDTDARIVDPVDGRDVLPAGQVGELVVRGPQVMQGYWNQPEETADVLRDGWLHTGDLARMDAEGYFFIVDRKKDMINAAGYKVWPREVEEILYRHPLVGLVAVVGVPDPYRGETVKACVVLKEPHSATAPDGVKEELLSYCRQHLAAYKVPRILELRDSLPMTAAGKVLRRSLLD